MNKSIPKYLQNDFHSQNLDPKLFIRTTSSAERTYLHQMAKL